MNTQQATTRQPDKILQIFGVIFAGFAFCLIFGVLFPNRDAYDSELYPPVHQAVESQLKAPSTVRYNEEYSRKISDTQYLVFGKIDAENSFGAMLRNYYAVTLEKQNGKWVVTECVIKD